MHGERTLEALSKYSQKVAELDQLEDIAHHAGVMAGPKRRGRKPVVDQVSQSMPKPVVGKNF